MSASTEALDLVYGPRLRAFFARTARLAVPLSEASDRPDRLAIEFLYLDLDTCDRCQGVEVALEKHHVTSLEQARALRLASSPTIRVDGRDVALDVKENACGACSELAVVPGNRRAGPYHGAEHAVPPVAMITEAILRTARDPGAVGASPIGEVDEVNLVRFLTGRATKAASGCTRGGSLIGIPG